MSDPILGWINIVGPVPEATDNWVWQKWNRNTTPVSEVGKTNVRMRMPNFVYSNTTPHIPNVNPLYRFAQYNYNVGQDFTLLGLVSGNSPLVQYLFPFDIFGDSGLFGAFIRYRVGNTVVRYQLGNGISWATLGRVLWPLYTGQTIKGYCSIEFYSWQASDDFRMSSNFSLVTSILANPQNNVSSIQYIEPAAPGLITDLQQNFGQAFPIPVVDTAGPYISN